MKRKTRRRIDWIDWGSVDWRLRNCEIAEQLGVYQTMVRRRRLKLGLPESPNRRKRRITSVDWGKVEVDWSLRNCEIAEQLGINPTIVHRRRRELGLPESPDRWKRHIPGVDWDKVDIDWSLRNCEIAERLGVDQTIVRRRRLKLGLPESPDRWKHIKASVLRCVDWKKPDCLIATETGVSPQIVRRMRKKVGAPPYLRQARATFLGLRWLEANSYRLKGKRFAEVYALGMKRKPLFRRGPIYRYWKEQLAGPERVPPWRLMNFALPSGVLGAVWRVSPFVVGYRRRSNGLCASRWCMHTQKGVAAYCVAVQREHEKARRYFATEGAA